MIQLITALSPIVGKVIDRVVPDQEAAAKAKREIQSELVNNINDIAKAQIEVNKTEAAHRNVFVAGWRPFIGWVCGAAFAYHFVLQPIFVFALAAYGVSLELPSFDMGALMTVLTGMLGLGGLRTFEKMKGTAK
jgi:hypothetical protein|tara:strand:+ start:116 stop:517 length:402 start_codon:yes stop_codon:yes gene_type:complete